MPDILHAIWILASPEQVYQALTTAEGIRQWWTTDADLEPKAGGRGAFRFREGRDVTEILVENPQLDFSVHWTVIRSHEASWKGTRISFMLESEGDSTGLYFAQRGFKGSDRSPNRVLSSTSTNWAATLMSLQEYLETGSGTPLRPKDHTEMARSRADRARPVEQPRPARVVSDGDMILASVDVALPPSEAFRALTSAELEQWWGAIDAYRIAEWRADLRAGGIWTAMRHEAGGHAHPMSGAVLEIDAPRRIVFTRRDEGDSSELGQRVTKIAYRFDPVSAGTRITVRHDGFAGSAGAAKQQAADWERVLGWLDDYARATAK